VNWINPSNTPGAGQGDERWLIIRLNDLVDKLAPNFKKVLDDHPIGAADCHRRWRYLRLPFLRATHRCCYAGPVVRQDYLDKLSLKAPTTVDTGMRCSQQ